MVLALGSSMVCSTLTSSVNSMAHIWSIQNQKIFLENYARGQHLTNIRHYIDDDESGRFFDRSAYSRMMDDVENGKIGVCIMKDLTRWGRDYLQVGNAMEIFRRNNVRFIAVNNGIDS